MNLLQKLETLSGFSGVLTFQERGRRIFKTQAKSEFCLEEWMNFSTWVNQVYLEAENYSRAVCNLLVDSKITDFDIAFSKVAVGAWKWGMSSCIHC